MPAFDLAQCFGMRQNFTSMDQDLIADGNVPQRSAHLRRRRDLPQTSTLPKVAVNHELGSAGTSMDPSFFNNTIKQSPSENRSSLKPPIFLMENSNHQPHHHTVSILLCLFQILLHHRCSFCHCSLTVQPFLFLNPRMKCISFDTDFNYMHLLW
jgi:hypothetical protein